MKSIYDSGWHHPFVAYVVGLSFLLVLIRRMPFLYGYVVAFLFTIIADATVTGAWSPAPQGSAAHSTLSIVFVVLGDWRYFLLTERVLDLKASIARPMLRSLAISLLVPLCTGAISRIWPVMQNDRVLYLTYECALAALILFTDRARIAKSTLDAEQRIWLHRVSTLFLTLYLGWAASDVIILSGIDAGHILRVVPNVLYYAVFVPFVFFTAPTRMKAWR